MKSFVSHRTRILLPDYSHKKIFDLYKENYDGNVLAQSNKGAIFPTKVLKIDCVEAEKQWMHLELTLHKVGRGHNAENLYFSPFQNIWVPTRGKFVSANVIKPEESISYHRLDYELSPIEEQVLIGKNLGDGSYDSRNPLSGYIEWGQIEKDYSTYALDLLRTSLRRNRAKPYTSGYGSTMYRSGTTENNKIYNLFRDWYKTGHKEFPASFINKLNPIALAFWYMDDGSLSRHKDQWDRVLFATNSFNEESIDNLITALARFSIKAVKYKASGWRLRLNADEAEKFFILIAPYIHPSKAYKLPERYRSLAHNFIFEQEEEYKPSTVTLPFTSLIFAEHPVIGGKIPASRRPSYHRAGFQILTEAGNFFGNNILLKDHS